MPTCTTEGAVRPVNECGLEPGDRRQWILSLQRRGPIEQHQHDDGIMRPAKYRAVQHSGTGGTAARGNGTMHTRPGSSVASAATHSWGRTQASCPEQAPVDHSGKAEGDSRSE